MLMGLKVQGVRGEVRKGRIDPRSFGLEFIHEKGGRFWLEFDYESAMKILKDAKVEGSVEAMATQLFHDKARAGRVTIQFD